MRAEDWHAAVRHWRACIAECPEAVNPGWHGQLSVALRHSGALEEAAEVTRAMRETWPDSPLGWRRGASAAGDLRDWPRAVALLEECHARFGGLVTPSWQAVLDRARRRAAAASRRRPAPPAASPAPVPPTIRDDCDEAVARAMAAGLGGDHDGAIRQWRDCLAAWPDRATLDWYRHYAVALLEAGRFGRGRRVPIDAEGRRVFAVLRDRLPEDPLGWVGEAESASRDWDRDKALPLWLSVIDRFGPVADARWYERLLALYFFSGRFDEQRALRAVMAERWPGYTTKWDQRRSQQAAETDASAPPPSLAEMTALLRDGFFARASTMLEALPEAARTSRSGLEAAQIIRTVKRSGLLDDVDDGSIDFGDRKTMVVWRNPAGSDRVILVFAGGGQAFWLSLDGLHRVLRSCGTHVIYMRDFSSTFYLAGDQESGVDYRGLLDVLRREIAGLGATRLGCLGNSGGGYAALRYALDLGAEAALSFSGITDPERWHDVGAIPRFAAVVRQNPDMALDLRRAFAEAPAPPRATLCFGEGHERDRSEAERMAGLPGIRLMPAEGFNAHASIRWFLANGLFLDLVADLFRNPVA